MKRTILYTLGLSLVACASSGCSLSRLSTPSGPASVQPMIPECPKAYESFCARDAFAKWETDSAIANIIRNFLDGEGTIMRFAVAENGSRSSGGESLSRAGCDEIVAAVVKALEDRVFGSVDRERRFALVVGEPKADGNEGAEFFDVTYFQRELRYRLKSHPVLQSRFIVVDSPHENRTRIVDEVNGALSDPNSTLSRDLAQIAPEDLFVLASDFFCRGNFATGSGPRTKAEVPECSIVAFFDIYCVQSAASTAQCRVELNWVYHPVSGWITREEDDRRAAATRRGSAQPLSSQAVACSAVPAEERHRWQSENSLLALQ